MSQAAYDELRQEVAGVEGDDDARRAARDIHDYRAAGALTPTEAKNLRRQLRERFPETEQAPATGRTARVPASPEVKTHAAQQRSSTKPRSRAPSRPASRPAGRSRSSRSSSSRSYAGRVTQPYTEAGSSIAITALQALLVLGVAYLLLNERGKGPAAFGTILGFVTNAVQTIIRPVDPLGTGTLAKPSASTSTSPKTVGVGRALPKSSGPVPHPIPGVSITNQRGRP